MQVYNNNNNNNQGSLIIVGFTWILYIFFLWLMKFIAPSELFFIRFAKLRVK